ncbi:hypothetical protein MTO96_035503 [Rhipicephalus appendiculatus]
MEKQAVQAIGNRLKHRVMEASPMARDSTTPPVSSLYGTYDSSCVPVPAPTEENEADGTATSRKWGRDDDESRGPREQVPTGTAPTTLPSDADTPRGNSVKLRNLCTVTIKLGIMLSHLR